MSHDQTYRLTQGTHTTIQEGRRVRLEPGAQFVPSTAELQAFRDRLELVESHPPEDPPIHDDPERVEEGEPKEWPHHTGGPWYELPNGEKVKGKEEADAAYQALMDEASE